MLKELKLFAIIMIIFVFALPMDACQRLNRSTGNVIGGNEENLEESNNEEKNKPGLSDPGIINKNILIPTAKNNGFEVTYGFTDNTGRFVIEPQFKSVEPFFESGIAPVTDLSGKMGIIDKTGKYVVEPQWNYLFYTDDIFLGYKYEEYISAVFDKNGRMLFQKEGYIADYSEGLSPLGGEGYLDTSGNIAIKLDYESLDFFRNGMAEVAPEYFGPSHYIDKNGNDLTDKVSSGLRMYKDETNNLFGFKNRQGDIVISAEYYGASPFYNGYAIVCVTSDSSNLKYGIIDTAGNQVLEPKYCQIKRLSNGLIVVGEEVNVFAYIPTEYFDYCKKALYTPDLKRSTDFIFDHVSDFDDEHVCVNDDTSAYFIDKELEQSRKLPKLPGRGEFIKDGALIRGYLNGKMTVIDTKGEILAQNSGDIDLGDGIISKKQVKLPTPAAVLSYPVISGLKDSSIEKKINDTIYYEMVEANEDLVSFDGPENTMYVYSTYVITRAKNLILIDQNIYTNFLGAVHGYSYRNTVYIDSGTGESYGLADLFRTDSGVWEYLSGAVTGQVREKMDEMGYFTDEIVIGPDTSFAVKQDGIVIYYAAGDIASYAAGMQEFFIPYSDLSEHINTEGDFWNAFK